MIVIYIVKYLVRFRFECALSLAKSRSRGWVQIKCSPKLLTRQWTMLSRITFEGGKNQRENWWPRPLKVCFCNIDWQKKVEPTTKRLARLTEDEIRELLVEKDSKNTQNATSTAVSTLRALWNLNLVLC